MNARTDDPAGEDRELSRSEYRQQRDDLVMLCTIAQGFDVDRLDAWIRQAERADTIGPFVDPTLWMRAGDNLRTDIRIAQATRTFVAALAEERGRAIREGRAPAWATEAQR